VLAAVALFVMTVQYRRGSRNPDRPIASRTTMSHEWTEKPFEKPRDESRLL
jgi:hypothetical protein